MLLAIFVVAVLCTACGGGQENTLEAQKPVLTIYVYAPEHPIATRDDVGDVPATTAENRVQSLHIWVFEHDSGSLVGYINPSTATLNSQQQDAYLMDVSDNFAKNHPNIDVYVLANPGNTLGSESSRDALDAAVMGHAEGDAFGLKTPTTSVPATGLPMSGVLRNQPVYGDYPVLRIGSELEMATVWLQRLVSKLRFVFTRSEDSPSVVIESITLDGGTVPAEEYLFLADDGKKYHVGSGYEPEAQLTANVDVTAACIDPQTYIYNEYMEATAYESLVENGIAKGELTQAGPFYLRESDRRLTGTIAYAVNGEPRQAFFQMAQAGDFARNHSWTVYGYFASSVGAGMEVSAVYVIDWNELSARHSVYNW